MLEKLNLLQSLEIKHVNLLKEIQMLEREAKNLNIDTTATEELDKLLLRLESLNKDLKKMSHESGQLNEELKTVEQKYEENVNPKEIESVYDKANIIKEQIFKAEDKELSIMEKMEVLEKEVNFLKSSIESKTINYKKQKDFFAENLKALTVKLQDNDDEIKVIREQMKQEILAQYDLLKSKLSLPVIVALNNGYCSVCGMEQPSYIGNENLVTCVNCSRIFDGSHRS
ncbi:hypothetical protein PRVXT_001199 [Proteinivorax tanatarense]|uniref:C4-type zinc ribbon domain-containing protein n=1 Tax=Proteinivorax tanatarense TaxID=1260629 RepID=A0AAU7VPP0_9FIRM